MFQSGNILIAVILGVKNYWRAERRSWFLSAGIFLLSAALTALLLIACNREREYKRRECYQQSARANVIIKDVTPKQAEASQEWAKSGLIRAGVRQRFGQLWKQGEDGMPSCAAAELYAMDEGAAFLCFCKPAIGRFPENSTEIALSKHTLEKISAPEKLGAILTIQVKQPADAEDAITEQEKQPGAEDAIKPGAENAIKPGAEDAIKPGAEDAITEKQDTGYVRTYRMKLVGILDGDQTALDYGLVSGRLAERQSKGRADVLFTLSDKKMKLTELGALVRAFAEKAGISFYEIYDMDGRYQAGWVIALPYLSLFFLVGACGYLLFYNIFAARLSMEQESLALLKSIGMSKRQKRCMIAAGLICQAFPAVLAGNFTGTLLAERLYAFSSNDIETLYWMYFSGIFEYPAWIYFFVGVCCFAVLLPARLFAEYAQAKQACGKKPRRLWGGSSRLCIVVSLVLCMISVNQIFSYAAALDAVKYQSAQMSRDCVAAAESAWNPLRGFVSRSDGLSEEITDYLKSLPIQKPAVLYKNTWEDYEVGFDYGVRIQDAGVQWSDGIPRREGCINSGNGDIYQVTLSEDGYPSCNTYGISREHLSSFIFLDRESDVWQKLESGRYVIYGIPVHDQRQREGFVTNGQYRLNGPETITAYCRGKACGTYQVIYALMDASVMETPEHGNGSLKVGGDAPYLYFAAGEFGKLYPEKTALNISFSTEEEERSEVEQALRKMKASGISLHAVWKSDVAQTLETERLGRWAYGALLGALITLFALLNAASLMTELLWMKNRELAVLEAVGMTKRQVKRMARRDYAALGAAAGTVGIAGAVFLGLGAGRRVIEQQSYTTWQFTIFPAAAVMILYFLLSFLLPSLCLHLHGKTEKSIGERIKTWV